MTQTPQYFLAEAIEQNLANGDRTTIEGDDARLCIDALRARLWERVAVAFCNADAKDWEHLDLLLGHSGHGKFWRSVFEEARAALAHPVAVERPTCPAVDGEPIWPEPKVTNPDVVQPTGVPYFDCLIHRVLDAQQDVNFHANEGMSQSLCDVAALFDEIETTLRKCAALTSRVSAPVAWRWRHVNDESCTWHYQSGIVNPHNEYIEVQPLYATPSPALDPATVEACAKVAAETAKLWGDVHGSSANEAADKIRALAGSVTSTERGD